MKLENIPDQLLVFLAFMFFIISTLSCTNSFETHGVFNCNPQWHDVLKPSNIISAISPPWYIGKIEAALICELITPRWK